MKYHYWYETDLHGKCDYCEITTRVFLDAVDCVYEGTECFFGWEGLDQICEKCLESKADAHLQEFHKSVDLV